MAMPHCREILTAAKRLEATAKEIRQLWEWAARTLGDGKPTVKINGFWFRSYDVYDSACDLAEEIEHGEPFAEIYKARDDGPEAILRALVDLVVEDLEEV